MINKVHEQKADMVIGDRLSSNYFTENKHLFHNFGNSLVLKSINHLFRCNFKKLNTFLDGFNFI